jgi:hypothetical protein
MRQEDGRHGPSPDLRADLELSEGGTPQALDHIVPGAQVGLL